MMYLLTYSGPAVKAYLKNHANARRYTQHVIRWGVCWGFLQASPNWDTAWQAEERHPISDYENAGEQFLLERVTPCSIQIQAPPLKIDDMWSEEVLYDQHIKAGNVLYIRGSMSEILDTAKQLNISTPWLSQHQTLPPLQMKEQTQYPNSRPQKPTMAPKPRHREFVRQGPQPSPRVQRPTPPQGQIQIQIHQQLSPRGQQAPHVSNRDMRSARGPQGPQGQQSQRRQPPSHTGTPAGKNNTYGREPQSQRRPPPLTPL